MVSSGGVRARFSDRWGRRSGRQTGPCYRGDRGRQCLWMLAAVAQVRIRASLQGRGCFPHGRRAPSPEKSVRAILTDDSNGRFHDQLNPGPGRDCWAILSRDLDGGAVRGALTLNLFLAYANRGRVVWAEARCYEIDPPVPRKVRVAAVNKPAQTMVVSPRGEILDRADTSPGSIARAECDLDQTVRDFSGRPLSRRYDVLRCSDTFGGLGDSIFERR